MDTRTLTPNGPPAAPDGPRPTADGEPTTPAAAVAAITDITTDIASDATNLVEDHGNLLAAEMKEMAAVAARGLVAFAAAAAALLVGLLFVLTGLVRLTVALNPTLPEWAAWLLWGVGLLVVGGAAAYFAGQALSKLDFLPRRTLRSLTESWSWLVNRLK